MIPIPSDWEYYLKYLQAFSMILLGSPKKLAKGGAQPQWIAIKPFGLPFGKSASDVVTEK